MKKSTGKDSEKPYTSADYKRLAGATDPRQSAEKFKRFHEATEIGRVSIIGQATFQQERQADIYRHNPLFAVMEMEILRSALVRAHEVLRKVESDSAASKSIKDEATAALESNRESIKLARKKSAEIRRDRKNAWEDKAIRRANDFWGPRATADTISLIVKAAAVKIQKEMQRDNAEAEAKSQTPPFPYIPKSWTTFVKAIQPIRADLMRQRKKSRSA